MVLLSTSCELVLLLTFKNQKVEKQIIYTFRFQLLKER